MAFKQKGFPMHSTKSALKAHPSRELDRLKADVVTFQRQYDEDPDERTKKDLDWASQALEEYMSGADGGDHGDDKENSGLQQWWNPWSKKRREKRKSRRAMRDFDKATEVRDGRTYTKEGYDEYVDQDGNIQFEKVSNREQKRRDQEASDKADAEYRDYLSQNLSDDELYNLRGSSEEEIRKYITERDAS